MTDNTIIYQKGGGSFPLDWLFNRSLQLHEKKGMGVSMHRQANSSA